MEACIPCSVIPTSREFKKVLSLASRDPPPTTPYIYLSWAQAEKRLREARDEVRHVRREVKWFSLDCANGSVRSDDLVYQYATLAKSMDRLEQEEQAMASDLVALATEFDMLIDSPSDNGENVN